MRTEDRAATDPVARLEREWSRLASAHLRDRVRSWQGSEPALRPFSTPQQLLRFLQDEGADLDTKDAVLRALLRRARVDPAAARVVLQALLPGLKRLSTQLVRHPRERDERWEQLLWHAWRLIRRYPLARRPTRIAANLLLDVRLGIRAEQEEAQRAARPPAEAEQGEGDRERPLRAAVRAGAISEQEAELIAQTRIDGVSMAAVADELRLPYITAYMRRHRAERRLLLFLGRPPVKKGARKTRSFSARTAGDGGAGEDTAHQATGRR